MTSENLESLRTFCDAWLRSWTGNQPAQLLGFYTDDAFYLDPARPGGLSGYGELEPYFRRLLAANPAWVWRALEVIPTAAGCTLKWEARIPLEPTGGSPSVGQEARELKLVGLDIVELREGKISRNEVYFDRTAWMAALAGRPLKTAT